MSLAEAQFYAGVYDPARRGSLAELRRRGCEEEEAEELFAATYAKVMESVDPIERDFSVPQMVRFVKRACSRRLIDERRRRAPREERGARPPRLPESPWESPAELAEEREAVAIGREALAMLSERDRLVFTRRHLRGMAPEEIIEEVPGLSLRTYRKVIQRANARVLVAFERIESGERCAELGEGPLRRWVAGESPAAERRAVEAHLAHCRACRQARARMRDYLFDVASGALLATSLSANRPGVGAVPAWLGELASRAALALEWASRGPRERLREALLRLTGWLPDPGLSPALGASSWRIASVCTAGVAAGACAAAGVVPGIGGVALSVNHHREAAPTVREARAQSTPRVSDASQSPASQPRKPSSESASSGISAKRVITAEGAAVAKPEARPLSREGPTAGAPASSRQVGTEFGPESNRPAPSSGTSSPSSRGSSVSGATATRGGGSGSTGGSTDTGRSSSEFGL